MAECVATPHSVVSRSIHPCVSAAHSRNLRNRPDGLAFNPLKCCRRNTGSLTAEISFRTQESLRCERRPGAPVRVSPTGNSSQEPIQLSAEAEEGYENVPAGEHSVSSIDFASSLVTAVGSDASSETELSGKKRRNRKGERKVYLMAAVASSVGFITLSAGAVYYRFYWQLQVLTCLNSSLSIFPCSSLRNDIHIFLFYFILFDGGGVGQWRKQSKVLSNFWCNQRHLHYKWERRICRLRLALEIDPDHLSLCSFGSIAMSLHLNGMGYESKSLLTSNIPQGSGEVPYSEMTGTFSLAIGAAVSPSMVVWNSM